jgi:hypothetical protein
MSLIHLNRFNGFVCNSQSQKPICFPFFPAEIDFKCCYIFTGWRTIYVFHYPVVAIHDLR